VYIRRTLEQPFLEAADHFPVLLVTGARQVGKTTFLRQLGGELRAYASLDDPRVLELARHDPALFMQRYPGPVIIDEIQYAPELLPFIKMAVDEQKAPGRYWLTGSQQFHLMKGVSESLAGRAAILKMLGLSRRERDHVTKSTEPFLPTPSVLGPRLESMSVLALPDLYQLIWRGSFPALAADEGMERDLYYSSYVQTYLQRDVRDLARVGDEAAFLRFVRACAARTAQILNYADLARDADIAPNTAKSWLSILETSGIIYLLEPYHTNVTKRLIKTPKLYFLDTGLCTWLTEWGSPQSLEAGAAAGAVLETWILVELLKTWWHNGKRAPFYYYRDKDKKEIDLLILQDDVLYPLEFKKTASPNRKSAAHFGVLEKLGRRVGPGGVICLAQALSPLTEDVVSIPVGAI
jgi:hypothetical protein